MWSLLLRSIIDETKDEGRYMREQLARPHSLFGVIPGAFYSSLEADIDHMVKGGEESHRCGAFSVAFGIETLVFEGFQRTILYYVRNRGVQHWALPSLDFVSDIGVVASALQSGRCKHVFLYSAESPKDEFCRNPCSTSTMSYIAANIPGYTDQEDPSRVCSAAQQRAPIWNS